MTTSDRGSRANRAHVKKIPSTNLYGVVLRARNVFVDGRNIAALPTRRLPTRGARRATGSFAASVDADLVPPVVEARVLADPPPPNDNGQVVPDNLVVESFASAADPILIEWGGFDDAFANDVLTFELDGVEFDKIIVVGNETPPFKGKLPLALRTEGLHWLTVNYTGSSGSGNARSDRVPITFDYTKPSNGVVLGPLLFDEADDIPGTGITVEKLREADDGSKYIWAEVAGYAGLAPGDRVHLFCNGKEAPDVGIATVIDKHIEVRIPEDFLRTINDTPNAEFTYTLEDRAKLTSDVSRGTTAAIQLTQITTLEEPTVPSYDDDPDDPDNLPLIDYADAWGATEEGFIVGVPWHDDYLPDDKILLSLDDQVAGPVDLGPDGEDMQIFFPFRGSQAVWMKGSSAGADDKRVAAKVTYSVIRGAATAGTSPAHDVELNLYQAAVDPDPETPVNERLQPLVVVSSSGIRDDIPVADFAKSGTVEIAKLTDAASPPIVPAFGVGDTLRIYYGEQPSYDFSVTTLDPPNDPLIVPLDGLLIENEGSGPVQVWYEVVHELADGGSNVNLAKPKTITVRGTDTQPGNGHLEDGTFPEAVEEHIPKPLHHTKARFEMPDYANRDADDEIAVHFEIYRGPDEVTGEKPYPGYDWDLTIASGDANPIVVEVPSTVYNLLDNPDGLSPYIHIHAAYSVTKKSGDTTPVTNDKGRVKVDARFIN